MAMSMKSTAVSSRPPSAVVGALTPRPAAAGVAAATGPNYPTNNQTGPTTVPTPVSTPFTFMGSNVSPLARPSPLSKPVMPPNAMTINTPRALGTQPSVKGESPAAMPGPNAPHLSFANGGPTPTPSVLNTSVGATTLRRRPEEDDRLRRLFRVIDILKPFRGHVCEPGLALLGDILGLDLLRENTSQSSKFSKKTLVIAGQAFSIDVLFSNHVAESVVVEFPGSEHVMSKFVDAANKVLFDNLKLKPSQSPLTKMLEEFSANLERLVAIDRLCEIPGLNCHEAVIRVYETLERIYQWDLTNLADGSHHNVSPRQTELRVLCTKNGRPNMYTQARLAMALDYWKERWMVPAMTPQEVAYSDSYDATYSLLITCAKANYLTTIQGSPYPPVRISADWLSSNIEKVNLQPGDALILGSEVFDWQEPCATFLPTANNGETSGEFAENQAPQDVLLAGNRLPEVYFAVTFDPPLVVPLNVARSLYSLVNAPLPQPYELEAYDKLMFPLKPGSSAVGAENATSRCVRQKRKFAAFSWDTAASSSINNNNNGYSGEGGVKRRRTLVYQSHALSFEQSSLGYKMHTMPFSHPRQLLAMLPTLRQHAMLTSLLTSSFGEHMFAEVTGSVSVPKWKSPAASMAGHAKGAMQQPPQPQPAAGSIFNSATVSMGQATGRKRKLGALDPPIPSLSSSPLRTVKGRRGFPGMNLASDKIMDSGGRRFGDEVRDDDGVDDDDDEEDEDEDDYVITSKTTSTGGLKTSYQHRRSGHSPSISTLAPSFLSQPPPSQEARLNANSGSSSVNPATTGPINRVTEDDDAQSDPDAPNFAVEMSLAHGFTTTVLTIEFPLSRSRSHAQVQPQDTGGADSSSGDVKSNDISDDRSGPGPKRRRGEEREDESKGGERRVVVEVEVGLGGELAVLMQNVVPPTAVDEVRRMARALQVLGNVGIWVNWLRAEFAGTDAASG